jgi:predicted AAA+ superfamily ATPase
MLIQRSLQEQIQSHILDKRKSVLLLGPRQTGKSSLLKLLKPDLTINLAREKEYQEHIKDPGLIEKMVKPLISEAKKGATQNKIIFIDEIQRIPSIINTVQVLIDDYRNLSFLISGSSARKLKKSEVNLLPGRVFSFNLFPLNYWELGENFDLMKCLSRGSLPEIYLEDYGPELLSEYISIYLREEILAEALVRNISSFSHYLDLAALSSWNELNYSQLASDSEIPKETIRRFMDLLVETLLIYKVPSFENKQIDRKIIQREKFLFFDIGVRNALLNTIENKKSPIELGHLFEQWMVLQIISYNSYYKKNWKLSYYRDDKKLEVDLIIETQSKIYALEIKWGEKWRSDWIENLTTFRDFKHHKEVVCLVIYRGDKSLKHDEVWGLNFETFFNKMDKYIE